MMLAWQDLVVIAVYLVAMLLMGVYFAKRNTDTEQYFLGGRSFSGWAVGLSLVGTSISSVTFLAYPADAYKTAWLRFLPDLMLPACALVGAFVFLPIYRGLGVVSVYEYLEQRFGVSVRLYGALGYILGQLLRVSTVLYLVALMMHEVLGWDLTLCIVMAGATVSFYTVVGGIDSVIWTDVVQTVMLIAGGVVCLAIVLYKLPGGLSQVFTIALADHKLSAAALVNGHLEPVGWGFSLTKKTGLMMLVIGLTAWLNEFGANQTTIQRYSASRSIGEARKAIYVNALFNVPIWAMYMFLGTALYAFFKTFPRPEATAMLNGGQKPEEILPFFIIHYLPAGVTGLVIAAALAAAMSTLSSSINAVSAVGVTDFYKRIFAADASDRHCLRASWALSAFTSTVMILGAVALANIRINTLQDTMTVLVSLLGAGLFGIFLLGLFTRRGDARAVWLGIAATLLFTAWSVVAARAPGLLPPSLAAPFELYYTGLLSNLIAFAVGYGVGCLLPPSASKGRDVTPLTVWGFARHHQAEGGGERAVVQDCP